MMMRQELIVVDAAMPVQVNILTILVVYVFRVHLTESYYNCSKKYNNLLECGDTFNNCVDLKAFCYTTSNEHITEGCKKTCGVCKKGKLP